MQRGIVVRNLLIGFLPIFIFIVADAFWGLTVGLIVAIVTGVLQMGYIYFTDKKFDKFAFLDTVLLIVMGGISILLHDDIFFKLKPAFIELILCILLGFTAFVNPKLMYQMSSRYMEGMEINDLQRIHIKRSTRIMFVLFSAHTALIFYSAYFMSKEAWAFISGGLFYILAGLYFAGEIIILFIKKKRYKKEEWFPIVNAEGVVTGKAPRSLLHQKTFLLHPVVHLHVMNSKGELFLQKRPDFKKVQPNKWDTSVGGHIELKETVENALKREANEELNLTNFDAVLQLQYIYSSDIEEELVYSFLCYHDDKIYINQKELADGRFWTIEEIEKKLEKGIFTPNFEHEFYLLRDIFKGKKQHKHPQRISIK